MMIWSNKCKEAEEEQSTRTFDLLFGAIKKNKNQLTSTFFC